MEKMEGNMEIRININEKFDSLYKLGYFLVDLNSICNFAKKINNQSVEDAKKVKKYSYGITSRYHNKDSLDDIKLLEFNQGSFLALFVAPTIVGVILLIIEKYINRGQKRNIVEIQINNPIITNIVNVKFDGESTFDENM